MDQKNMMNKNCGGALGPILREALDWVFIAATFAILFNLYDSNGIELKHKPKGPALIQGMPRDTSVSYPGFKTPQTSQKSTPPVSNSGFTHLSLEGVRLRYGKAVFVDARPNSDYLKGHIAGAIAFDVNDFTASAPIALPFIPRNLEVITYCSGGDCDDSVLLASKLKEMGYTNLKIYEGGYPEWKKTGLAVTTGATP